MTKNWMTGWKETIEIRDPSHINLGDGTKLYQHWLSCQKQKKLPVLKFVRAVKANLRERFGDTKVKKKKKVQWLDVSNSGNDSDRATSKKRKRKSNSKGKDKQNANRNIGRNSGTDEPGENNMEKSDNDYTD
jgi:hypothetical protein